MDYLVARLLLIAEHSHPLAFQGYFGAIISNVVSALPETYWQKFKEVRPCDEIGCDCHKVLIPKFIEACTLFRKDHGEFFDERQLREN